MEFEHRVAIVTGGTGALGSSVALDLLRSGARVVVTYRVRQRMGRTGRPGRRTPWESHWRESGSDAGP